MEKSEKSEKKIYINIRERIGGLIYVLLFFCLGTGFFSWKLISQSDIGNVFSRKNIVNSKMKRQQEFKREQENFIPSCEHLIERIQSYDPSVKAVYEKNDIQFMIDQLRRKFEQNNMDRRYMVYFHLSVFYQMWFNDKQYLWSLNSNQAWIKKNLEDCELGLNKKKDDLKNGK